MQIKKRFDYVRKQLKSGNGKGQLLPPGYGVDHHWSEVADGIAGKKKKVGVLAYGMDTRPSQF